MCIDCIESSCRDGCSWYHSTRYSSQGAMSAKWLKAVCLFSWHWTSFSEIAIVCLRVFLHVFPSPLESKRWWAVLIILCLVWCVNSNQLPSAYSLALVNSSTPWDCRAHDRPLLSSHTLHQRIWGERALREPSDRSRSCLARLACDVGTAHAYGKISGTLASLPVLGLGGRAKGVGSFSLQSGLGRARSSVGVMPVM